MKKICPNCNHELCGPYQDGADLILYCDNCKSDWRPSTIRSHQIEQKYKILQTMLDEFIDSWDKCSGDRGTEGTLLNAAAKLYNDYGKLGR